MGEQQLSQQQQQTIKANKALLPPTNQASSYRHPKNPTHVPSNFQNPCPSENTLDMRRSQLTIA